MNHLSGIIGLNAGGILQLTVGEYITPKGHEVDGIGLLPTSMHQGRMFADPDEHHDDQSEKSGADRSTEADDDEGALKGTASQ